MPGSTRASELQSCSLVAWPQTCYLSPSLSFFRKISWSPLWGPQKDGARQCMWVPSTTPLSPPASQVLSACSLREAWPFLVYREGTGP